MNGYLANGLCKPSLTITVINRTRINRQIYYEKFKRREFASRRPGLFIIPFFLSLLVGTVNESEYFRYQIIKLWRDLLVQIKFG